MVLAPNILDARPEPTMLSGHARQDAGPQHARVRPVLTARRAAGRRRPRILLFRGGQPGRRRHAHERPARAPGRRDGRRELRADGCAGGRRRFRRHPCLGNRRLQPVHLRVVRVRLRGDDHLQEQGGGLRAVRARQDPQRRGAVHRRRRPIGLRDVLEEHAGRGRDPRRGRQAGSRRRHQRGNGGHGRVHLLGHDEQQPHLGRGPLRPVAPGPDAGP